MDSLTNNKRSFFNKIFIYTHLVLILSLYLPLITLVSYSAFLHLSIKLVIFSIAIGCLIWTLVEYLIHRFIFHGKLPFDTFKKFQFFMHGYHHVRPTDPNRLVLPLIVTLPLTILIYLVYKHIFGVYAEGIFVGFVLGYLSYDVTHYSIHRFTPITPLGKFIKRYHFRHHFKVNHRCFGVTSPLWDRVFKTQAD